MPIVARRDDSTLRLVRARRPGEIEALFPKAAVQHTPAATQAKPASAAE